MCMFCRSFFVLLAIVLCSSILGLWLPLWYLQALPTPRKTMITIFPLWTFHLYVATFQQHLYKEYAVYRYRISISQISGRRGCYRIIIGYTTTYAIIAYHHWCFDSVRISISARCKTCDKVCQWLARGRWFSQSPPASSTNKTDRHDTTEILLRVALNTINQTLSQMTIYMFHLSWALPGHFLIHELSPGL
jgi:hypothetical protein